MSSDDVVERFAGTWSLHRIVADARAGTDGVLDGVARAGRTDDGVLAFAEDGVLTFGGSSGPATRRLLLRGIGARSVEVAFPDGRPFYAFTVVDDRWTATHVCGRDTYTVAGRFLDDDAYEEVWHAVGPEKRYTLTTTYRRSAGSVAAGSTGVAS